MSVSAIPNQVIMRDRADTRAAAQARDPGQGAARTWRSVEAGNLSSTAPTRVGRASRMPPQFGHEPPRRSSAQSGQKVHSKLHILAAAPADRSLSQHSQLGLRASTRASSSGAIGLTDGDIT
jgi:hypothetical protein